jgi:hypothetical protein
MYQKNTFGHILQALRLLGLPESVTGEVILHANGLIVLRGTPYASYKYFDSLDQPLFRFQYPGHYHHKFVRMPDNLMQVQFGLSLSPSGTPGFEIHGGAATQELWDLIVSMKDWTYGEDVQKLTQAANPIVLRRISATQDKYRTPYNQDGICVEFWNEAGAQAWLDKLSQEYTKILNRSEKESVESRVYSASWTGTVIRYLDTVGTKQINIKTNNPEHVSELKVLGNLQVTSKGTLTFTLGDDEIAMLLLPGEYESL